MRGKRRKKELVNDSRAQHRHSLRPTKMQVREPQNEGRVETFGQGDQLEKTPFIKFILSIYYTIYTIYLLYINNYLIYNNYSSLALLSDIIS